MNKKYLIPFLYAIATFLLTSTAQAETTVTEADLHVDEFGTTVGKPINNGFVFVDGQYVDAPYVVSRKGLAIFINDKMIRRPTSWPRKPEPSGDIDPVMPPEINKMTDMYDKVLGKYVEEKMAYIRKHYAEEEASKMMEQVYRNLPCIKEVRRNPKNPTYVFLIYYNGQGADCSTPLYVPPRKQPNKENMIKHLEHTCKFYEESLSEGGCRFLYRGGEFSFGSGDVIEELPQMVRILRSSKSEEEKLKELGKYFPDPPKIVVTNFSASPQLEERLNALVKAAEEKRRQ